MCIYFVFVILPLDSVESWYTEAEFLDVIGIKVLGVFLLAIHSHLYKRILPPTPKKKVSGLKVVGNVNIEYGILKSENSQDYDQKTQTKLSVQEFSFWCV
jgi:hypothetical protein